MDELNQSQSVRTLIVIGPSASASHSDNLLFTPDHKRRSRKRSQLEENGNFLTGSSDPDSVTLLMTLLTIPIFGFH